MDDKEVEADREGCGLIGWAGYVTHLRLWLKLKLMLRLMELRLKLEQGEAAFISFLQVTDQGAARGGAAGASKVAGLLRQQRHVWPPDESRCVRRFRILRSVPHTYGPIFRE